MNKLLLFLSQVYAFSFNEANQLPVQSQMPGFREGENLRGVKIEVYYDLLCTGCAVFHPVIN